MGDHTPDADVTAAVQSVHPEQAKHALRLGYQQQAQYAQQQSCRRPS